MFYKNISNAEKTFYGITFKPGEIKESKNYINDRWLIKLDDYVAPKEKSVQQKPSSDRTKKEATKLNNNEKLITDAHKEVPVNAENDVDTNKS